MDLPQEKNNYKINCHTRDLFSIKSTVHSGALCRGRVGLAAALAVCALLLHSHCGSVSSQSEPDGRLGSFVPDDRDLSQFWVSFIVFAELNGWLLATYSLVSPDVLYNYFSSYSREGGRKGLKSAGHWIRQQKKTGIG